MSLLFFCKDTKERAVMDYMQKVEQYFKENGFCEEGVKRIMENMRIQKYEKGNIIQEMGTKTKQVSLIMRGLVRGFFIDEEGKEITQCFAWEQKWCCVYNMLSSDPSRFWVEALEDSVVLSIEISIFRKIIQEQPECYKIFCGMYANAIMQLTKKQESIKTLSAMDRYKQFEVQYPALINRLEKRYIASYLEVPLEALNS